MNRSLLQAGLGRRRDGPRLDDGNGMAASEIVESDFIRVAVGRHEWYPI